MNRGRYNSSRDVYEFDCAGCGLTFEDSDGFSPLDGLDCCSVECDRIVEARPAPICSRCECPMDIEDGTCGCNPEAA